MVIPANLEVEPSKPVPVDLVSEEDFKTYMGVNAYKFEQARQRVSEGKITVPEKVSFAAIPFYLSPAIYSAYYKYYIPIIVTVAVSIITRYMIPGPIGSAISLGTWLFYLMTAKTFIVKDVNKKILKFKAAESDPERQKQLLAAEGKPSIISVVIIIAAAFGLLVYASQGNIHRASIVLNQQDIAHFQLPACNSDEAIQSVKDAIENGPYKKVLNLQVLDIQSASESRIGTAHDFDMTQEEFDRQHNQVLRHCQALAILNSGSQAIAFDLKRQDMNTTSYIVQVQAE